MDKAEMFEALTASLKTAGAAKEQIKAIAPDLLTLIQFFTQDEELGALVKDYAKEFATLLLPVVDKLEETKIFRFTRAMNTFIEVYPGTTPMEAAQMVHYMNGGKRSMSFSLPVMKA